MLIFLPYTFHSNHYPLNKGNKHPERLGCDVETTPLSFEFACYSQPYKVGPLVFWAWANILRRGNNNAALRFVKWPNEVEASLLQQANSYGLTGPKIDFVERIKVKAHLERSCFSDLVLDTPVLNGGTTVLDALSATVPVVTMPGQRMPARVAVGLVQTIIPSSPSGNLLVPQTMKEYENHAHDLAFAY